MSVGERAASSSAVAPEEDIDRFDAEARRWCAEAVAKVRAEGNRSSDTHLLSVPLPEEWGVDLYLKDESTHPTGSLKHRLARSLFLHALCNGWVRKGRPVIEASSGSTAVSEAYFARLIGVPFIAVMAQGTSRDKIRLIELHGGRCHFVERPDHRTSGSRGRGWTSPRTWSGWRVSWGAGNWGERRRSDGRDDEDGESALWGAPWAWLLADSYGPLF